MYKKFFNFFCLFILVTPISILVSTFQALAEPHITSASGTILNGSSITIEGLSFGSKSPAAPILWETFNSGTNGGDISKDPKWTAYTKISPKYSSTSPYGGTGFSAYNDAKYGDSFDSKFGTAVFSFKPTNELYYSYMSRYSGSGNSGRIYKNGRINTGSNSYSGDGMIALSDNYVFYRPNSTSVYPDDRRFRTVNIGSSKWQRHQIYGKVSDTPGTANGSIWVQVHTEHKKYSNIVTRASGYSFQYGTVILGLMIDNLLAGDQHHMYVDDVYVDNTQARIELCDTPTWSNRTHCDIQIPSAWSGSSITATVNQGAFLKSDKAYIYVVDANGVVNSSGYPVTIGEILTSKDVAPPEVVAPPEIIAVPELIAAPKGLRIIR